METSDDEIRKAYQAHVTSNPGCLDAEVLEAFYTDRLPSRRMEEVRSHLTSCPICLELARDYCAFRGISPVLETEPRRFWFSRPMLAVAAGLLLAAGLGVIWTGVARLRPSPDGARAVRGFDQRPGLRLISPLGQLKQLPRRLEWSPADSAEHYEVEIQDARFNSVWKESRVKDAQTSIPESVLATMSDRSYAWRVTAVTHDGRRIVSPFATFEVVP